MMRKEFRSYGATGCLVLLSTTLVNTDETIVSVLKSLIPKNGKDMLILSVRLAVIFKLSFNKLYVLCGRPERCCYSRLPLYR